MRSLDLDHLRSRSRAPWVRYALVAAAIGFAVDQGLYYRSIAEGLRTAELRLASTRPLPAPASNHVTGAEEIAMARDTVGRLSTPWNRLFAALEKAHTDQVSLLSIEPDAEVRTVTINGEAKDYLAALTYLASLADQPALRRVHLVRHENQRAGSTRPLSFTVSAAWTESR